MRGGVVTGWALVAIACGCGGTTGSGGSVEAGAESGPGGDASASGDAAVEAATDGGSICAPGTCTVGPSTACETPSGPTGNGCCQCGTDGRCSNLCRCAAPDTPIATPSGYRPIASIREGDLVYSVHRGALVAVPVARTSRVAAPGEHAVVRVVLADGATVRMSGGHPTADGRLFAALRAGDLIDGARVAAASVEPYGLPFTYDVLPSSDTGTYLAAGILVGSTLGERLQNASISPR